MTYVFVQQSYSEYLSRSLSLSLSLSLSSLYISLTRTHTRTQLLQHTARKTLLLKRAVQNGLRARWWLITLLLLSIIVGYCPILLRLLQTFDFWFLIVKNHPVLFQCRKHAIDVIHCKVRTSGKHTKKKFVNGDFLVDSAYRKTVSVIDLETELFQFSRSQFSPKCLPCKTVVDQFLTFSAKHCHFKFDHQHALFR